MDNAEKIAATQAAAASQLAEVAENLQRAAAEAQNPTQRLLLMRQLRKVHEAYRALTQVESVNTQSVPIQLPSTLPSDELKAVRPTASGRLAKLLRRDPSN